MKKWILFLSLLMGVLGNPAKAEHAEEQSGFKRPIAKAELKDCGARIGQATLRYPGLGLFAFNTYDLKIDFDADGMGVTLDWNLGTNGSLKLRAGDTPSVTQGKKTIPCKRFGSSCFTGAAKVEELLAKAKYRLKNATDAQKNVLSCVAEKVALFRKSEAALVAKEAAVEAKYWAEHPQPSSTDDEDDDDDSRGGVGVYVTPKGVTTGFKSGPFVIPFDGSGPTIGF
jgi:hypothetical protein